MNLDQSNTGIWISMQAFGLTNSNDECEDGDVEDESDRISLGVSKFGR